LIGRLSFALLVLVPSIALAVHPDEAGCQDPPLFTRMPGHWIQRCKGSPFDVHKFHVGPGRKYREESVEGRFSWTMYSWDAAAGPRPSQLQVIRNYQNAAKALGGEVLNDDEGLTTLRVAKNGVTYWAEIKEYGGAVSITLLEPKPMAQEVVGNATVFAESIESSGHAAVYGVYFDTGLAVLKPESGPALVEIAKLLAAKPGLKLRLVGHTDAVGGLEANMKLSQARAGAVLAALTGQHGVAADRVSAHGVGPLAPVATNGTEEGRARNRRVELVAQ
jgi:outer membrane protein OmpA-like peptidoglycan-associated protein